MSKKNDISWSSPEFIRALPKTDLHVHLDGSLRLGTLIELAKERGVDLPSYEEAGLRKNVFKDRYKNLEEYLAGFSYTTAVMQDPESLERIGYEFAKDCFDEGVFYVEVRLAPQRHAGKNQSLDEVFMAVDRGLDRAKREINSNPDIVDGRTPGFEYGIIGCAMRMFESSYSDYYKQFCDLHPDLPDKQRFQIAAFDLVRAMVRLRDEQGIPIVGFDLAGEEEGYPAAQYAEAYMLAQRAFLKKTVHAGEAYGPASIFQAITKCNADRIGHGTNLFRSDMLDLPTEEKRDRYVEALAQYIADRRITVEVCLTSNVQTIPSLNKVEKHPFGEMVRHRLSTTFCTDNRLISNTTVSREIELALQNFKISPRRLREIIIYGFKRSFFAGDYLQKRAYVRRIIDYYDEVQERFS